MDLDKQWENLANDYAEEVSRVVGYLSKVSPASDEYTRAVQNLKTLQTAESQTVTDCNAANEQTLKIQAQDLREKEQQRAELKDQVDEELRRRELELKQRELELKEREQNWSEEQAEAEAAKPEMGRKDWLQILVPVVCVAATLLFEIAGNGVITTKAFAKIPFGFK